MPDIAFVESENNLDRSASHWDIFEHRGKFICELSEETTSALDNLCQTDSLHWRKAQDRSVYSYYDEGGVDGLYHIFCLIGHDGFTINYEVDESEGIFGLQRAFKMAGVQTIIMSLWKVHDKATNEFIRQFYENYICKEEDKYTAFTNAQKALRESEEFSDPFYWASFIILDGDN